MKRIGETTFTAFVMIQLCCVFSRRAEVWCGDLCNSLTVLVLVLVLLTRHEVPMDFVSVTVFPLFAV